MPLSAPTHCFAALLLLAACHGEVTRTPVGDGREQAQIEAEREVTTDGEADTPAPPRDPYRPASSLAAPIGVREATRTRTVYDSPAAEARERGRIMRGESFHVYAERDGPGCDRPWVQVGDAAWVCGERTAASEATPRTLPTLEAGMLVPFIYARHPEHDEPKTAPIPVYRSLSDYRGGAAPVLERPAYGSYAFTRLRPNHGDPLLIDGERRVVRATDLELFEPSEFAGRDLVEHPVVADQTLAWAIRWKTLVRAAPEPEAEVRARIKFHTQLRVVGDGVSGPDGERYFEVPATEAHAGGWVAAADVRRFVPLAPPEPVLAGRVTIDVDLDEQVLSVWIEERPVFVTLISSGKPNDQTPPGLYRIETKRAYGKMESLPHAREPYFVEAVPWTMYFHGRYALHAAYWHDMFGHRMSHGCVNLSPQDAKRVFELTGPRLPEGWLLVHEHAADPGALVRIRRQGAALDDFRPSLEGAPSPRVEGD